MSRRWLGQVGGLVKVNMYEGVSNCNNSVPCKMPILDTTLACSLCGEDSTVREIGDHLAQVHIGPGDSDWHCSNGCLYRTSSKAEMASHCLITRHPAAELTRPLAFAFPQLLAEVQRQFCQIANYSPAIIDPQYMSEEILEDDFQSYVQDERQDTELALSMSELEPDSYTSHDSINEATIVQNSESEEKEPPESKIESPRSPEQFDRGSIPESTHFLFKNKCDNCSLYFKGSDVLKRHTNVCTGVRPLHVLSHNNAAIIQKLRQHQTTISNEMPFNRPTGYKLRHEKKHTVKCPTCHKSFAQKTTLRDHQRTHTERRITNLPRAKLASSKNEPLRYPNRSFISGSSQALLRFTDQSTTLSRR